MTADFFSGASWTRSAWVGSSMLAESRSANRPAFFDQSLGRTRYGLQVDVAAELMHLPQLLCDR